MILFGPIIIENCIVSSVSWNFGVKLEGGTAVPPRMMKFASTGELSAISLANQLVSESGPWYFQACKAEHTMLAASWH